MANLFEVVVSSGYIQIDFLNKLCVNVLLDFNSIYDAAFLSLTFGNVSDTKNHDPLTEVQRLRFTFNDPIAPAVSYVAMADEHFGLSKK